MNNNWNQSVKRLDKLRILVLLVVSTIFITGSSSQAWAFVINFEDLTGGDVFNADDASQPYKDQIPDGPVGLGVRIYADNIGQGGTQTSDLNAVPDPLLINHLDLSQLVATDLAVVFDSSISSVGVEPDLEASFDYNGPLPDRTSADDPGNILIIQEDPARTPVTVPPADPGDEEGGCGPAAVVLNPPPTCVPDDEASRPNGQFIFEFTSPVAILSMDVFDVETDENDPNQILFYDENGNFLGQFSDDNVQTTGGNNLWNQVPLNSIRVKTMIIEWPGSGAIDNIVYDIPVGGQILSIESTPLLIKGVNTSSYSILGVLTMLGLAAFGAVYYTSKKRN